MKRYDSYKDSGINWIGEIPKHWELKRFKYYFDLITERKNNNLKKIGLENIESLTGKFIISDSDFEGEGIYFKKDYILFGKLRPYLAKVWLAEFEGQAIGDFYVFRCKSNISPLFAKYRLLSSSFIDISNNSTYGAKMPRVNWDFLSDLSIVFPATFSEQTSIAAFLDRKTAEIDRLIADKKRLIELYEEEKTAIINQAVTKGLNPDVKMKDSGIEWIGEIPEHWELKRLKYYFDLITDKKNINFRKIGLENIESKTGRYIESDSDFEGDGIFFKKNDVLFGKLRPYLAKVWLAEFEGQAVGDFYVLRCKSNISALFTKHRLLSYSFIEISNNSTYGAKMPRVSWDFLADLPVAFPLLQEQLLIANYLESECTRIHAKVEKTKKLIALLTEYRTTLISEVVTGKIKVT